MSQCKADLAAWNEAWDESTTATNKRGAAIQTAEKQGASQDALFAIAMSRSPDLEERLSVEELIRAASEADRCFGRNEVNLTDKLSFEVHETVFLRELLSRAETVISRAHRNEEYLLEPTYKIGGTQ